MTTAFKRRMVSGRRVAATHTAASSRPEGGKMTRTKVFVSTSALALGVSLGVCASPAAAGNVCAAGLGTAAGSYALACGLTASAPGSWATAIGYGAYASGQWSSAHGF